jgi:hypothetical protein
MRYFWPVYLSVAVAGTAAIYFIAPRFRPAEPGEAEKPEPVPVSVAKPLPPPVAQQPAAEAAAKPAAAGDDDFVSPAFSGIYIAKKGEASEWGIITKDCPSYTKDGSNIGQIRGGTLFAFKSFETSSKGAMVLCSVIGPAGPSSNVCLVKKEFALLFTGDYHKLPASRLEALKKYYALRGSVAQKKSDLLVAEAEKNPFFTEYQARYKVYNALVEKAKAMEKEMNASTGMTREKLLADLAKLRQEETSVSQTYNAIRQKYNDWKSQHVNVEQLVERNPDIVKWRGEMDKLIDLIPGLAI